MSRQLEADTERQLVAWVKRRGGKAIKFTPYGENGWPDRIVMFPHPYDHEAVGFICWVELKRRGLHLSDLQQYRYAQLRAFGQRVIWGDTLSGITSQLEAMLDGYRIQTARLSDKGYANTP